MKRSQNPIIWLGATCVLMVLMVVIVLAFAGRKRPRLNLADAGPRVVEPAAPQVVPGPCTLPAPPPAPNAHPVTECEFIAVPTANAACPWRFDRWDLTHCGAFTAPPTPATPVCAPFPAGERQASGRFVAGGRCAGAYSVSWWPSGRPPPVVHVGSGGRHVGSRRDTGSGGGANPVPGPTTVNVNICANGNCEGAPSTNARLHPRQ
jgi:hypothetical protein